MDPASESRGVREPLLLPGSALGSKQLTCPLSSLQLMKAWQFAQVCDRKIKT